MDEKIKLFDEYFITENDKQLTLKALAKFNGFEKFGFYILYLIPAPFIWYIPIVNKEFALLIAIIKILLIILLIIVFRPLIRKILSNKLLVLDKEKKVLKSILDNDSIKLSEIKEIEILEEKLLQNDNTFYKLKFKLSDGDKTSNFAFTRHDRAKEIKDIIKKETS